MIEIEIGKLDNKEFNKLCNSIIEEYKMVLVNRLNQCKQISNDALAESHPDRRKEMAIYFQGFSAAVEVINKIKLDIDCSIRRGERND